MVSCPVDEIELDRVLAGEATPDVEAHVRRCRVCGASLEQRAHDEASLQQVLFRVTCPTSETLARLHLGWLDENEAERVRQHLEHCPHCGDELAIQAELLDLPIHDPVTEDCSRPRLVAQAVDEAKVDAMQNEFVLRGRPATPERHYQADNIVVTIDVEEKPSMQYKLTGLIRDDPERIGQYDGATVLLKKQQQECAREHIDDVDTFVFRTVLPDTYTMELYFDSKVVVIEQLEIGQF